MGYHIIANFPANRDYKGTLKVYNSSGSLVFGPVEALGRGTNDDRNGGDHTNWKLKYADIPTGEAKCIVYAKGDSNYSYGPYKRVWLNQAVSGNFLTATQNGRDEIMIHSGDPETNSSLSWYPLRPTYGCIRLSNSNQKALIDVLEANGGSGTVTINNV